MRTSAAVLFLLLFACEAFGQSQSFAPRYSVGGFVLIPYTQNHSQVEVRLLTDSEISVNRVFTYPQDRFSFSNLQAGRYFIVMDVAGYKPVRQLVEAMGFESFVSMNVTLEPLPERVSQRPIDLTGEGGSIDVKQLARRGSVVKYLAEAEKKLKRGSISEARSRLESIVLGDPYSYDAHRLLGAAYQQGRRYRDAEKSFLAARGLQPKSVMPLISLAGLYLEEIEGGSTTPEAGAALLEEARKLLILAVETSPQASFAHYLMGVVHYKRSLDKEAVKSFHRALELEPGLGTARLGLAKVYVRARDWPAALVELDVYLKGNPPTAGLKQIRLQRAEIERLARP